jgi:hypothetical protein
MSHGIQCNITSSYLSLDDTASYISQFDINGNYINSTLITSPRFIIVLTKNNVKYLYITTQYQLLCVDQNFKLIISLNSTKLFGGIYYNTTSGLLLVSTNSFSNIELYSQNLTFVRKIDLPYPSNNIAEYNGSLYVSSLISYVMIIKNEVYDYSFNTACSNMRTLAIDQYGLIAVNCYDPITNYILLYSADGALLYKWLSSVPIVNSIGFDIEGNLILASQYGLYQFSSTSPSIIPNSISYSMADSCIIKGIINPYLAYLF